MPPSLPPERWALTPPFHPYPCGRFVFCGTFRPPGIDSGCLLLSQDTLPYDVRTFLYAADYSPRSGHPNPNGGERIHHSALSGKTKALQGAFFTVRVPRTALYCEPEALLTFLLYIVLRSLYIKFPIYGAKGDSQKNGGNHSTSCTIFGFHELFTGECG